MIVLPEGIYHRFTLDSNNFIKVRYHCSLQEQVLLTQQAAHAFTCPSALDTYEGRCPLCFRL